MGQSNGKRISRASDEEISLVKEEVCRTRTSTDSSARGEIMIYEVAEPHVGNEILTSIPELENYNCMILMGFLEEYTVGKLCCSVNEVYAQKHNYEFCKYSMPFSAMAEKIVPKMNCSWFKMYALRQTFKNKEMLNEKNIKYIMWIDADAIFINHAVPLQDIVRRAREKDLIVGEDLHPGCLINSGAFLLKVSEWSEAFLEAVWRTEKYDDVCFYEQSAMLRVLREQGEELHHLEPFHSYVAGGPKGVKFFPHVAVYPSIEFNTDRGISRNDVVDYKERHDIPTDGIHIIRSRSSSGASADAAGMPQFIYHPTRLSDKVYFLLTAMELFKIPLNPAAMADSPPRACNDSVTDSPPRQATTTAADGDETSCATAGAATVASGDMSDIDNFIDPAESKPLVQGNDENEPCDEEKFTIRRGCVINI